jgi:hypothetical protein
MKKILVVLALFGFGMMVGCGDDTTGKPKTSGTTAPTSGSGTHSSPTPSGTK